MKRIYCYRIFYRICCPNPAKSSVVAQAYNLCYSGGRDKEDPGSRPARAKKFVTPASQQIKTGCGGTCLSSQLCGTNNRRI
jgi:hypothetical protein